MRATSIPIDCKSWQLCNQYLSIHPQGLAYAGISIISPDWIVRSASLGFQERFLQVSLDSLRSIPGALLGQSAAFIQDQGMQERQEAYVGTALSSQTDQSLQPVQLRRWRSLGIMQDLLDIGYSTMHTSLLRHRSLILFQHPR